MTVWKAGMLAVCVDDSVIRCPGHFEHRGGNAAKLGSVIMIDGLSPNPSGCGCYSIVSNGARVGISQRYRPAVQDDQACEEDFVTLLKRGKPAKQPILIPNRHERVGFTQSQCASALNTLHSSAGAGEAGNSHSRLPENLSPQSSDHALAGITNPNCFIANHGEASNG